MIQRIARRWLRRLGFDIVRSRPPASVLRDGCPLPDAEFYAPLFSPWRGYGPFANYFRVAEPYSLVSPERCWVLYSVALQCLRLDGDLWECGVYKGGTAMLLAQLLADSPDRGASRLHLFDTFGGMPDTDPSRDRHKAGDFSDTSLDAVRRRVGHPGLVDYHPGVIPATFAGLESSSIAFAHVDVDIHQAVADCCRFVFPRIISGGAMIFDDYGFPSCPGARLAVDEYFADTPFVPLVLPTGQALVFKHGDWHGH